MAKEQLSYSDQLKHPKWQKLRLQRLEFAQWECESCGSKESTLHVHHKQYFKGRMAWEYEFEELAVLCESCHETDHFLLEEVKQFIAREDAYPILGLLTGFHYFSEKHDQEDTKNRMNVSPEYFLVGLLAHYIGHLTAEQMRQVETYVAGFLRSGSEVSMQAYSARHLFD